MAESCGNCILMNVQCRDKGPIIVPRTRLTNTLPLTRSAALWYLNWAARLSASSERGRMPSAINGASAHVALRATNYRSNCGDRQRQWRTLRLYAGEWGRGRPQWLPAITIRAPAQTACCDLPLFVPGMRPCQSDVRCSAEGQRLTVLERQQVLLAANVPRISAVSSSYSTSEAGKKAPSPHDWEYSNGSHQRERSCRFLPSCLGLLGTRTDLDFYRSSISRISSQESHFSVWSTVFLIGL